MVRIGVGPDCYGRTCLRYVQVIVENQFFTILIFERICDVKGNKTHGIIGFENLLNTPVPEKRLQKEMSSSWEENIQGSLMRKLLQGV